MEKLDGKSMDIAAENISKMKELFPEVFCEGKIDFERLQEVLGEYIEEKEERYSFNWKGKSKAIRIAQTQSTGTLRPAKEESKNFDTTENLYIEGDNLEVLKLLQKTYNGKVKMIYIDPPYNTGNDFVYPDDFRDNIKNYLEITGQVDEDGRKMGTNSEASGRYHTDWLNMMYPRLKLARNLLSDDGIIFISIDDCEIENLRKICNEIFGETNLLTNSIWISGRTSAAHFTNSHEYVLGYAKCISSLPLFKYNGNDQVISDRTIKRPSAKNPVSSITFPAGIEFDCEDKLFPTQFGDKEIVIVEDGVFQCEDRKLKYEVTLKSAWAMKDMILNWLEGEDVYDQKGQKVTKFYFKSNGVLQYEKERGTVHPNSVIKDITTKDGTNEIKDLFELPLFPYPKPTSLINYFASAVSEKDKNNIILDFFSGSASSANAVIQLNAQDQGNRKFIMVQIPEACDKNSEAYKAGYKTICEIGKERIRRAGEKIVLENKDKEEIENLDIGFKVFKLDSSNIKKWDVDADNLEINMENMIDNFVPNRTEEDVVYEIMIKYGIDLTYPVEMRKIENKKVFNIGFGALFICLDNDITIEVVEGMVKFKDELNPDITRVVFKDNGFKNDSVKTNAIQILKRNKIEEIMSI